MADEYVEKDGKWYDPEGRPVWRAGTLVYYRKDLIRLFFWLYVGQFTFWMEHIAIPMLFPLLMAKKGFNAAQIGSLWSIFPMGALILFPIIGTWSDRTRTRWGRRRPWDMLTTPVWFLGLVLLPFITTYWQALGCMVLVGFAGAGSNVLTAFYNDVVPAELLGRFNAGMRLLGTIGGIAVQLCALPLFDLSPGGVFVGLACIGFTGEMLMLFMVKEGEYPPPPPYVSILKTVAGFIKEGFANRYIVFLWLTMGVTALGGPVMGTYFNLFFTDAETGLGLTAGQLGRILALGSVIGATLILPAGWVVDLFGPKKLWGGAGFLVGSLILAMYFFAKDLVSVGILFACYAAVNTVMTATLLPLMYSFIPKDKFGQLNGSNQIVGRLLQIVGVNVIGLMIFAANEDYRATFIFGGVAYLLTPLFLWLMLRQPWPYGNLTTTMHPDGKRGMKRDTT